MSCINSIPGGLLDRVNSNSSFWFGKSYVNVSLRRLELLSSGLIESDWYGGIGIGEILISIGV